MFNPVKGVSQGIKAKQKAEKMKKMMAEVTESVERGSVRVKVNGAQEIEYVEIDGERNEDVEKAINEAMRKVQEKAIKELLSSGKLNFNDILGELGK